MATGTSTHASQSDAELIASVRAGDRSAYDELYRRHVDAARAAARSVAPAAGDVDDLVAEGFTRVLSAIERGGGPQQAFRPYLLTSVRNARYDQVRKDQRLSITDDVPEDVDRSLAAAAAADSGSDRDIIANAFAALPERWQAVLWYTEVEGRPPAEVAPLLGIAPNAVAALAYRAREGLRQAYLSAHVQLPPPEACQPTVGKLAAYVRDDLSDRDRRNVDDHVESCERCREILAELEDEGSRLRAVLIPLVLGVPATAYLSQLGAAGGLAGLLRRRRPGSKSLLAAAAGAATLVGAVTAFAALPDDGGEGSGAGSLPSTSAPGREDTGAVASAATAPSAPVTIPVTPATTVFVTSVVSPTAGPTSSRTTAVTPSRTTVVTTRPPRPTAPPTAATTVPPPPLRLSFGTPGPALAGLELGLPVTVSNGAAPAARSASWRAPRRSRAAADVSVAVQVPPEAVFAGSSNDSWTCIAESATVRCALPRLDGGASTETSLRFRLDESASGRIRFTSSVWVGSVPLEGVTTVVVEVVPAGDVDDLVLARGDVVAIGNSVVTCNPASARCEAARAGTASPRSENDRTSHPMVLVDVDRDPSTANSSRASLVLPAGARVVRALLVWSASLEPGDGGAPAPEPAAAGRVLLTTPAGGSIVDADQLASDAAPDGGYVASKDVTALVREGGTGAYTVAGVQAATGVGAWAGWGLVVAHEEPSSPERAMALFVGPEVVSPDSAVSLDLPGLAAGSRAASVTYVAAGGARGLLPEELRLDGKLVNAEGGGDPQNPLDTSVCCGEPREPGDPNTFSVDVDRFTGNVDLRAGEVVTTTFSSKRDRAAVLVMAVAVDV